MGARAESVLQAGDKEVRLLYTNRALAEAEAQSGKSIVTITTGLSTGASGIGDIAVVLRAGMEAARRESRSTNQPVSLNDAYEVMDEVGFEQVTTVIVTAIAEVISYGSKNV